MDPTTTCRVLAGFWAVFGGFAVLGLAFSRYQLVEVVLNLRNGEKYVPLLDDILRRANFSSPSDRAVALRKIAGMVHGDDVDDGGVMVHDRGMFSALMKKAEARCAMQMDRAGVRPDSEMALPAQGTQQIRPGDHCVLGVVFTTRNLRGFQPGGPEALPDALRAMAASSTDPSNCLYTYYAPDPGQELDTAAARDVTRRLTAESENPPVLTGRMTAAVWIAALLTLVPSVALLWYSTTLK
jgi:hypothetical protein